MRKIKLIPILFILILLFSACGKEDIHLTSDQYPVCRGDVIASRIATEAMCALTGISAEEARGYTRLLGSESGYEELLAGVSQLVFTTEMPDDATLAAATQQIDAHRRLIREPEQKQHPAPGHDHRRTGR